jgi:uncharacterized protein YggE
MTSTHRITGVIGAIMLLLMLAATLPFSASAQSTPTGDESDRRVIVVEGTGTVDIAPDTADIAFGVLTQNESLEAAQDENSTRTQAIIDTFGEAGIAQEDIATSGYSIYVINEYDRDGNLVGIQGYEVWNQVTVTIRDLSIVGKVLDDAVGAGANTVGSISFYVDDTDAAASQARVAAVENARAKADELAEASGVLVIGVYSIEETSAPDASSIQYDMAEAAPASASDESRAQVPVSPGQTQVTVRVQVVFEIDQPQG